MQVLTRENDGDSVDVAQAGTRAVDVDAEGYVCMKMPAKPDMCDCGPI